MGIGGDLLESQDVGEVRRRPGTLELAGLMAARAVGLEQLEDRERLGLRRRSGWQIFGAGQRGKGSNREHGREDAAEPAGGLGPR